MRKIASIVYTTALRFFDFLRMRNFRCDYSQRKNRNASYLNAPLKWARGVSVSRAQCSETRFRSKFEIMN